MLTEEEKVRIRAEELFRHEVRQSFRDKKTFWDPLWTFVNSSFGLWVMSTVVVGSIIYFYNDIQSKQASDTLRSENIRKIKTEIFRRLNYVSVMLSEPFELVIDQNAEHGHYKSEAAKELTAYNTHLKMMSESLDAGATNRNLPLIIHVFPEFKERTLNSLLFELKRLEDDAGYKEDISTIQFHVYETLRYLNSNISADIINGPTPGSTGSETLQEEFNLRRRKAYMQLLQAQQNRYFSIDYND